MGEKKKSQIPSKELVTSAEIGDVILHLKRFVYSRSSLNLVLRVYGNLKKPKIQKGFIPHCFPLPQHLLSLHQNSFSSSFP